MRKLFRKLWKDDAGNIALEYLGLLTIVGLGLFIGFSNVEDALNTELSELGNAILALNQGYAIVCQSGCKAVKDGSCAIDNAGRVTYGHATPPPCHDSTSLIDIVICP